MDLCCSCGKSPEKIFTLCRGNQAAEGGAHQQSPKHPSNRPSVQAFSPTNPPIGRKPSKQGQSFARGCVVGRKPSFRNESTPTHATPHAFGFSLLGSGRGTPPRPQDPPSLPVWRVRSTRHPHATPNAFGFPLLGSGRGTPHHSRQATLSPLGRGQQHPTPHGSTPTRHPLSVSGMAARQHGSTAAQRNGGNGGGLFFCVRENQMAGGLWAAFWSLALPSCCPMPPCHLMSAPVRSWICYDFLRFLLWFLFVIYC